MFPSDIEPYVADLVRRALAEDIGAGDATTQALVDPRQIVDAVIVCRPPVVACGSEVVRTVFQALDPDVVCTAGVADGAAAPAGTVIMELRGRAQPILTGERTALNFMQRMTGIATLTRRFVEAVGDRRPVILDTRKTTPTLRVLEKYAVRCGGGQNHRFGLYDRVMIKDNHRQLAGHAPWAGTPAATLGGGAEPRVDGFVPPLGLEQAILRARRANPGLAIEVEVESMAELEIALRARPEWVLLDNMGPEAMAACVRRVAGQCLVEASGGITLDNVAAVAATGVDAISLGCLTHSAPAADLSLEVVRVVS
ncbi:MAG: nicotinate-nucleotide diphosphorylase [Lentisphaerae bacterium]|nr:nicotinate-nucleotide diphosphorylase [Lentisphaerota bacterium]